MRYSLRSMWDLAFLIPVGLTAASVPPPKFMLFMESKQLCERAALFLMQRLPEALCKKVVWVHADMLCGHNQAALNNLKRGDIFGIVCTDVAGMVNYLLYVFSNNY